MFLDLVSFMGDGEDMELKVYVGMEIMGWGLSFTSLIMRHIKALPRKKKYY